MYKTAFKQLNINSNDKQLAKMIEEHTINIKKSCPIKIIR